MGYLNLNTAYIFHNNKQIIYNVWWNIELLLVHSGDTFWKQN